MRSLEVIAFGVVIMLIDVFEASAIVNEKLSRHAMANRLFLKTLELNYGFRIDLWSAPLWIDELRWIEVEGDIAEFGSVYCNIRDQNMLNISHSPLAVTAPDGALLNGL
jgi:hypothetical protein